MTKVPSVVWHAAQVHAEHICTQSCRAAPTSEVETTGATRFEFNSYVKEHAVLVNEALDRLVPLQHPEDITEPMR